MDASVIVPVLNEGPRLRRCVEAILAQDLDGRFEVLVVDGGSSDGCLEALDDLPVTCLEAPGSSPGEARNLAATRARGSMLAFTDADCIPLQGWLQGHLDCLAARPGIAGAGGALRHLRSGPPSLAEDLETRAYYRGIITSNVAYRAAAFRGVGGFDPRLRCAEDWDLGWRMLEAGHRLAFCPEAVVVHDPGENGDYLAFLRKQVWYARNDVPAVLGTLLGLRGPSGTGAGRRDAAGHATTAGFHAAAAALVASGLFAPLGLALLGGWAAQRVRAMAALLPEARGRELHLWAHLAAKGLARGAGTWMGLLAFASEGAPPAPELALPAPVPASRAGPRPASAPAPAPAPAAFLATGPAAAPAPVPAPSHAPAPAPAAGSARAARP